MAYKMNRFWILLKPCHVFPDWMIVEGIVQLRVRVVQEDKEEVETCIRLQPTPRCQETCSAAFKLDLLIIPARPAFKLDSNYIIQPHIQTLNFYLGMEGKEFAERANSSPSTSKTASGAFSHFQPYARSKFSPLPSHEKFHWHN